MIILVAIVGLLMGYILNNYILTVDENEKGNFIKFTFDKKKTVIIFLWNLLVPVLLFLMYGGKFCADFFRDATLSALCSAVFFIDFKLHIIPNKLNIVAFILGCIYIIFDRNYINNYIIAGISGLVFFLLIIFFSRLILKRDGMGLGDAKFVCVVGLMSGIVNTISIIFLSFVFGSIGAIILLLTKKKGMGQEIAFGPYIVIATMLMMFFGNELLSLYFSFML